MYRLINLKQHALSKRVNFHSPSCPAPGGRSSLPSNGSVLDAFQHMALLLGVDRFMSDCRALTNIVGNGVATIVISAWEKELNRRAMQTQLKP